LERSIRSLPIPYRAPIILRDVEGLSTREAAEVMELTETAFKSRLHRGRLAVRAHSTSISSRRRFDPPHRTTFSLHARASLDPRAPLAVPRP
ncbi:MAG: hypothetical protein JJE23_08210, partial [Thermoleophilia bacterium]|nr:hypothetical protein [Thermoleophilia bacterium]